MRRARYRPEVANHSSRATLRQLVTGGSQQHLKRRILLQSVTHFNKRTDERHKITTSGEPLAPSGSLQARYRHRICRLSLMARPIQAASLPCYCPVRACGRGRSIVEQMCEFCMKARAITTPYCGAKRRLNEGPKSRGWTEQSLCGK